MGMADLLKSLDQGQLAIMITLDLTAASHQKWLNMNCLLNKIYLQNLYPQDEIESLMKNNYVLLQRDLNVFLYVLFYTQVIQ